MQTNHTVSRRVLLAICAALPIATLPIATLPFAGSAFAMSQGDAQKLITSLTTDIFQIVNSGKSEAVVLREFEKVFAKYADVPIIAKSSLGVARRSASSSQIKAYTKVFLSYLSQKYGKRFNDFAGATVKITKTTKTKRGYLVDSKVKIKGNKTFLVQWQVSDASGRNKVFDIIIEGISMLRLEREEIGVMLDRRGGDVNKLIAHLRTVG